MFTQPFKFNSRHKINVFFLNKNFSRQKIRNKILKKEAFYI